MEIDKVQDSGERREWSTGSIRDTNENKGRYDLIPEYALWRVAYQYQKGAKKYSENNWLKGQNLRTYLDSAIRHLFNFKAGFRDEDHLAAAAFNVLALIETEKMIEDEFLPKELNDLRIQPYKKEKLEKNPNYTFADWFRSDSFQPSIHFYKEIIMSNDGKSIVRIPTHEFLKSRDLYTHWRYPSY